MRAFDDHVESVIKSTCKQKVSQCWESRDKKKGGMVSSRLFTVTQAILNISANGSGTQICLVISTGYSYDAVVFSAASNYYQQQQRPQIQGMGGIKAKINGQGQKVPMRPQKAPPKPSQLHYCEICKISCAGPLVIV